MSYAPPANLSEEDKALEADLVQAYRRIIILLRDELGVADDASALRLWRIHATGLLGEARQTIALLTKPDGGDVP